MREALQLEDLETLISSYQLSGPSDSKNPWQEMAKREVIVEMNGSSAWFGFQQSDCQSGGLVVANLLGNH